MSRCAKPCRRGVAAHGCDMIDQPGGFRVWRMAGMTSDGDADFAGRAVDAAIKIGLVALLAV
jgi:hypothetical protein